MYDKVKSYMRKHHMVEPQDVVIVGVSGGADSVCLLCVLCALQEEMEVTVRAVHIHHGLRGAEADRDEAFVKAFCEEKRVPFTAVHVDVKEYAARQGLSEEEAGRELRRQVFERERERVHAARIALAHHREDNAETMILNLARGTGLYGMAGIRPVSGDTIHPLLCTGRDEIEEWLKERGIAYCIDRTNLEDTYTRNRIRRQVIPCLKEQVNIKAVEHMSALSERMDELRGFVERQAVSGMKQCVSEAGKNAGGTESGYLIRSEKFAGMDPALKPYLIRRVLTLAAKKEKDIESAHVEAVLGLFGKAVGKRVSLPYGLCARRSYEGVRIGPAAEELQGSTDAEMEMRVFPSEGIPGTFPADPYTKWFDYDIIQNDISLRTRRPGDYLTIDGSGHRQKINRYFINEKIPQEERDGILMVADGQHIMWIVGHRQNQSYQVTEDTRTILEIKIKDSKGENHGRENQSISVRGRD